MSLALLGTPPGTGPFYGSDGGYPWHDGELLYAGDLNAAIAACMWNWGNTLNVADYKLPNDPDDTFSFQRAIAAAIALNCPTVIDVPPGTYVISATITAALSGPQGIYLRGASSSSVIVQQTVDADGFVGTFHYGSQFQGGSFNVSGMTIVMAAPVSSSHTALSISSDSVSGATGVPIIVDDIAIVSTTAMGRWAVGLKINEIADIAYISRISVFFADRTAGSTGIVVTGNSTSYSTSIFLTDIVVLFGYIALDIQNYLQGVHVRNFNNVNSRYSVNCTPTAGVNLEIRITNSYLHGLLQIVPAAGIVLNSININNCYIDSISTVQTNDNHVVISGCPQVQVLGNQFNGPGTSKQNVTGLTLGGGSNSYQVIVSNNQFQAYQGTGSVAVNVTSGTREAQFLGNTWLNNASAVTDNGTGTAFYNSCINFSNWLWGHNQSTTTMGNIAAPITSSSSATFNSITTTGAFTTQSTLQTNLQAIINGAAGTQRNMWFETSGQPRWRLAAESGAESGSNAGSDLVVQNYSDTGGGIGAGLCARITRATGQAHFYYGIILGNGSGGDGASLTSGNGLPTATAPRGSLYSRLDGAAGATLYVSQGAGTWLPVAGV